jgi:peptide deformylase
MFHHLILTFFLLILFGECFGSISNDVRGGLSFQEERILKELEEMDETKVLSVEIPTQKTVLEQVSRTIQAGQPWIKRLTGQMERTVRQQKAMGLAAVQIGIPVRVVLLQRREGSAEHFHIFVNPEIINHSEDHTSGYELCLSVPWGYRLIERYSHITVRALTLDGIPIQVRLDHDEAAVFQQEMDHLDGILLNHGTTRQAFISAKQIDALFSKPSLSELRISLRIRNAPSSQYREDAVLYGGASPVRATDRPAAGRFPISAWPDSDRTGRAPATLLHSCP